MQAVLSLERMAWLDFPHGSRVSGVSNTVTACCWSFAPGGEKVDEPVSRSINYFFFIDL